MEPFTDAWSLILFLFLVKQWIFMNNKETKIMTHITQPPVDDSQIKSDVKKIEEKEKFDQIGDSDQSFTSSNLVEFLENKIAVNTKVRKMQKELEENEQTEENLKTKLQAKREKLNQIRAQNDFRLKCLQNRLLEIEQQLANTEDEKQRWKNKYFEIENEMDVITAKTRENEENVIKLLTKKAVTSRWNILVNNICFFTVSGYLLSVASKNFNHQ